MTVTLKKLMFALTGTVLVTLTAQAGACDRYGGARIAYRPQINYQYQYQQPCQTYRPVVQPQIQQVQPFAQPMLQAQAGGQPARLTIQGQPQEAASVSAIGALGGNVGTAGFQQQNAGFIQAGNGQQTQQFGGVAPQNNGLAPQGNGQVPQSNGFAPQNNGIAPQQGNNSFVQTNGGGVPTQNVSFNQSSQANLNAAAPRNANPTSAAPAQSSEKSAQAIALEALMGLGGTEQAAVQQAPETTDLSGNFQAKVSTGANVRLSLNRDGSFVWVAEKEGKSSNFQGNYAISGNSLTLQRSDSQKLEGTLIRNASGFNLKLAGQNGGELNFAGG